MLRGLALSSILHIFLITLVFYIMPNLFYKNNKNLEIAIDIISIQDLPVFPSLNPETPQLRPKKKSIILPKPILDDDKIIEKKILPKQSLPKKKLEKKNPLPAPIKSEQKALTKEGQELLGDKLDEEEYLEFNDILNEIKKVQQNERMEFRRKQYIYGDVLNYGEKQNIKRQVNSCWINITDKLFRKEEIIDMQVRILVSLDIEGNVLEARLADSGHAYMGLDNEIYRQLADSALSVFYRCKKITGLPKDKYEAWKEFEFIFDPNSIY